MSYQVIARKWRPQVFDQLIGQAHISTTLLNSLRNDRIPHAFLFTGPRGTGKTSTARILAKSLRCPFAVDFVPCGVCDSCVEIATSRSVDVVEIDGASNNGVDSIRELRDSVHFMPASGKYKIYIIDEVHMLSTSAFNALLKTLEEPPDHVIFMMATTEVHKIPQTILSRCQRFDFRKIPTKVISQHLKKICETDGFTAEDEALWLIARQAGGSMRDSQSLLDQVISFSSGKLEAKTVVSILGLTDRGMLQDVLNSICLRSPIDVLKIIERMAITGIEPEIFIAEFLEMVRNLLLSKISPDRLGQLLDAPDNEQQFYKDLAENLSEADIHMLFDMAMKSQQDIAISADGRMTLEVCLLRMASAPQMIDIKTLLGSAPLDLPAEGLKPSTIANPLPSQATLRRPAIVPSAEQSAVAPKNFPKEAAVRPGAANKSAINSTVGPAVNVAASSATKPPGNSSLAKTPANAAAHPFAAVKALAVENVLDHEAAKVREEAPFENHMSKWLRCIDRMRSEDARLAAKVESMKFIKEHNHVLQFQFPHHLSFLQSQMADKETRARLQTFIDLIWGAEYNFEIISSQEKSGGESSSSLMQKKKVMEDEDSKKKIEEHPQVIMATRVFKAKIHSVTDMNQAINQVGKEKK